jgi:hypothetical protein
MTPEEFKKRLNEKMIENREAFEGKYKREIKTLMGLSEYEVDAITPDSIDIETYDALVTVVKEASRSNLAQSELKKQIQEMGDVAVKIAEKVPGLLV